MADIETTRETLKEASIDLLKLTGWKPGDKFSFHSVSELMVALSIKVVKGEIGCDYPSCGCCADAACADAIKQHPDLGGTSPQMNVSGVEALAELLCETFASADPGDDGPGKAWPYAREWEKASWRKVAQTALAHTPSPQMREVGE